MVQVLDNARDAVNLMRFLSAREKLRQKPVYQYRDYERNDGRVIKLGGLGADKGIDLSFESADLAVLKIEKLAVPDIPDIPDHVDKHVEGDLTDAHADLRLLDEHEAGIVGDEALERWREAHSEIESWITERSVWAEEVRSLTPAIDLYQELFRIRNEVNQRGESIELVLAGGLLN